MIKKINVNNFKSYPQDKNLYLFKGGLIKKINTTSLEQFLDLGLEVNKDKLINNNKELTINDNEMLIPAAIKYYNDLTYFSSLQIKNDKAR